MQQFPPFPPDYYGALAARWALVVLNVVALGWLVRQVRKREAIRGWDALLWFGFFCVAGLLLFWGTSSQPQFNGGWSGILLTLGTLAVFFAGAQCEKSGQSPNLILLIVQLSTVCGMFLVLLPGHGHPPEASHRTQCKNHLKQLGLAIENYRDVNLKLPPSVSGKHPISWRVALLPFLDETTLAKKYDPKNEWDAASNFDIARHLVEVYRCPSNYWPRDSSGRWFTAYAMVAGPGTIGTASSREIPDGVSNTLLLIEACGQQIVWTEPRDVDVESLPMAINRPGHRHGQSDGVASSYHSGGAFGLLADGTVRFLSKDIDPKVLKALTTADAGDDPGEF